MSNEFWAWFFISGCFISFIMMFIAAVYFPKIQTPWFARLWKNDYIRILYAGLGIMTYVFCWMFAGAYAYNFRIIHHFLGLER